MNLQENIKYIREACVFAIAEGRKMDSYDFENNEGVFMTFNKAIEIVNEIDRLKAEKAELLAALQYLLDEQNDAPIWSRANEWQSACDNARELIEKAEKTLPE